MEEIRGIHGAAALCAQAPLCRPLRYVPVPFSPAPARRASLLDSGLLLAGSWPTSTPVPR